MRNDKSFALPVEFTWKRARAGYQWSDTKHGRLLYAVDALQPDWQNTFKDYETIYRPLDEHTGLFREFAALEPNEQQVVAFANRFGLLGSASHLELESKYGPVLVYAESLALWEEEIEAFKLALEAWDGVGAGANQGLIELKSKWSAPGLPLAIRRAVHLDDDDPAKAALSVVRMLADARISKHIETRLRFRAKSSRLNISLVPTNLIGALWLQFAVAVDGLKSFNQCAHCGASFEVSRDPRTGKRSDALFCSSRCRVGHYRDRIEQARRMGSNGMTAKRIAHEMNAEVATVQGWLGNMQTPGAKARRAGPKASLRPK
jgi:hypothetical protein